MNASDRRCFVCGHYHRSQGGCVVAMALAWDPIKKHCLKATCTRCKAALESAERMAAHVP